MSYSIKNLRDIEDAAARHGFSEHQESRFPREDLQATATGLAYHIIRPGRTQAFGHRHRQAEEVAVVLSGTGQVKLDDEIVDVGPLDAIRIAPSVARAFRAGPDGLELLVFGPRHVGDAETLPEFWPD